MPVSIHAAGSGGSTEADLFRQAQEGCRNSLNVLMAAHDGLVQAIVRQQVLGDLPFAEALQAGRIGLWRAILGYDPQRGHAFSTYAWPCIVRHLWRAVQMAQHLDQPRQPQALATALVSRIHQEADPFRAWEAAARHAALDDLLARLPGRLRYIVRAHYGLHGDPPASFRSIGRALGLSGERMRQLHTQALACADGMLQDAASRMRCSAVRDSCYQPTTPQAPRPCPAKVGGYLGPGTVRSAGSPVTT